VTENELPPGYESLNEAEIEAAQTFAEECRIARERYDRQKSLDEEIKQLDLRRLLLQWGWPE
jgi:hypothetical protein